MPVGMHKAVVLKWTAALYLIEADLNGGVESMFQHPEPEYLLIAVLLPQPWLLPVPVQTAYGGHLWQLNL